MQGVYLSLHTFSYWIFADDLNLCPQGLSLSSPSVAICPSWSINVMKAESKTEQASPPACMWVNKAPHFQVPSQAPLPSLHFTSSPINNSFGFSFSCLLFSFPLCQSSEPGDRNHSSYLRRKRCNTSGTLGLEELLR